MVICSTIYEVSLKQLKKPVNKLLTIFSILNNGSQLFDIKKLKSTENIECLNGMRTICICFVVFRNAYSFKTTIPIFNGPRVSEYREPPFAIFHDFGQYSVDTFLTISGFLVAWNLLKELERTKTVHLLRYYVNRYLRLTPSIMALLIFVMGLARYINPGPSHIGLPWTPESIEESCRMSWWHLILYVQNYIDLPDGKSRCYSTLWYINLNMQLFLISPFLIWPLWKYGRRFLFVIGVMILLSMGCIMATWVVNDYRMSPYR